MKILPVRKSLRTKNLAQNHLFYDNDGGELGQNLAESRLLS